MENALSRLATDFGTDKGPKAHNYTELYERWMAPKRYEASAILEFGLWNGASALMWHAYFTNAKITMLESDEYLLNNFVMAHPNLERINLVYGRQENVHIWNHILAEYGPYDFVIDDGSHVPGDQFAALTWGFQYLKPGGLWIIEDTHTSFWNQFNGLPQGVSGMGAYLWLEDMILAQQMGGDGDGNFYRAREGWHKQTELQWMIYGIQSYKSLIVLERARD